MIAATRLRRLEAVLKALANRRRLLILITLQRHGELHVSALAEDLRLPLKTVSRNLRLLERAGVVVSYGRGGRVFYRLDQEAPSFSRAVLKAAVGDHVALKVH